MSIQVGYAYQYGGEGSRTVAEVTALVEGLPAKATGISIDADGKAVGEMSGTEKKKWYRKYVPFLADHYEEVEGAGEEVDWEDGPNSFEGVLTVTLSWMTEADKRQAEAYLTAFGARVAARG